MSIFKNFFTAKYLFETNIILIPQQDKYFFVAGVAMAILAFVFKLSAIYAPDPVNKKYRQKFFNLFLYIGFCELIWYGARVQHVRFFGSRFVAWLVVLVGLMWLARLILKMAKNFGKEKNVFDKEQVKLKYLPK
jgi:hypothetical protein